MSLQNHLSQLRRRHTDVDRELHEAMGHPSIADGRILELKRQKLHLKDQIAALELSGEQMRHAA